MSRRLSKKAQADYGLIFPVILALALSVISFLSLRYVIRSKDDAVLNHAPDLIQVQRLVIASSQMNESSLGYLFSRRAWHRQKLYEMMRARRRDFMDRLSATRPVLSAKEGRGLLEEASRLAERYFARLDQVIALERSGAPVSRVSVEHDRQVVPIYTRLTVSLRRLTEYKEKQFEAATDASMRTSVKATRLILISGLMAIALGALLSFIFFRMMEKRRGAEESLQETLEIRDEFLSVASHELQNPITALLMQMELLDRMIGSSRDGNANAQQAMVGRCLQEVRRVSSLVNELLDLTRLRAGKLSLARSHVDLVALVREMVAGHEAEARLQGSTITVEAKETVTGFWDPMRMSQVAFNLISNAIKYGGGKPVVIVIENDPARDLARLVVRDEGIGMTQETQGKIFLRFERGVTSQKIRGLGLGLYIVRQIVDAHGGRVFAQSVLGKGSTFIVELPRAEAIANPSSEQHNAA